ncbi:MAG: hypothetical protein MZW92_70880 [Comamonadaceae bacterium]|nr:hypothetical protein [Comamonadaceae bacterium]
MQRAKPTSRYLGLPRRSTLASALGELRLVRASTAVQSCSSTILRCGTFAVTHPDSGRGTRTFVPRR